MSVDSPDLGNLAEAILGGTAPERIRAAAARGAVPLPRVVLVGLWVHLLQDGSAEIRDAATTSLNGLAIENLAEVLQDPGCSAEVLTHFVPGGLREAKIAEPIVFHEATPETALARLAFEGNAAVAELVLTNQQRLLAQPQILNQLMENPVLGPAHRARILEMLATAAEPSTEQRPHDVEVDEGAAEEEQAEWTADTAARLLSVDVGELLSESEIFGADEFEEAEDPEVRDTYFRIVQLNTAQKAILALKGGRQERLILVRDSNRVVSLGVLKNPRMTETEIEAIAKMRNVHEDILRQLGTRREWTKLYPVVLALLHNPRTPPTVSTNLVQRLGNKDLRNLAGSRDVPELLRRMARRVYETRTQRKQLRKK